MRVRVQPQVRGVALQRAQVEAQLRAGRRGGVVREVDEQDQQRRQEAGKLGGSRHRENNWSCPDSHLLNPEVEATPGGK